MTSVLCHFSLPFCASFGESLYLLVDSRRAHPMRWSQNNIWLLDISLSPSSTYCYALGAYRPPGGPIPLSSATLFRKEPKNRPLPPLLRAALVTEATLRDAWTDYCPDDSLLGSAAVTSVSAVRIPDLHAQHILVKVSPRYAGHWTCDSGDKCAGGFGHEQKCRPNTDAFRCDVCNVDFCGDCVNAVLEAASKK